MRKSAALVTALNTVSVSCFSGLPFATLKAPILSSPKLTDSSRIRRWSSWDEDTEYPSFEEGSDDLFPSDSDEKKLGVSFVDPMSPEEMDEMKEEIKSTIDDTFEGRMEEIAKLKEKMAKDFEESKETMRFASDLNLKIEGERLMNKIDAMSNKFLQENEELRRSTKAAAAADQAMEGKGVDLGSWGVDQDGNIVTAGITFGSLASNSEKASVNTDDSFSEDSDTENSLDSSSQIKILAVLDESQTADKMLLDTFSDLLRKSIPDTTNVAVERITPFQTAPFGGLNCQTVILFASSLSDRKSVNDILERVLKRTAPVAGSISTPPTHIVCVSSLGTKRLDKLPYSMMNFMGGKKLEKRRDMEEAVISKTRRGDCYRPLDYTVVKVGNVVSDTPKKGGQAEGMLLEEGDSLDGDIGVDAAANVLLQAVAFQAAARNVTFSAASSLSGQEVANLPQEEWDDMFLRVDGPELYRLDIPLGDDATDEEIRVKYERLKEYVEEWADTMFVQKTKTGLTTPVTVETSKVGAAATSSSVKILFKQTATGSAYKSKDEERAVERQQEAATTGKGQDNSKRVIPMAKQKKEGGLEVIVEMKDVRGTMKLRVRGRRCNMSDDTVVKEKSEGVLVKKLKDGVQSWIDSQ